MAERRWGVLLALVLAGCFERGSEAGTESAEVVPPEAGRVLAAEPAGERDPEATVRVALEAEPPHLNPLLTADGVAGRVALGDVYEGLLCAAGPGAEPAPCLAEREEVDEEGRRFTFTLREGVVFHDGEPLSAADVIYTFERARERSWLAAELDDLETVEAPDERTVVLTFGAVRPGRRGLLARVPILPRHVFGEGELTGHAANRAPVGTGPLRFERWAPGESIVLRRFDDYWGEPALAAAVEYLLVTGRQQALAQLVGGRIDVAAQIPVDEALGLAERRRDVQAFRYELPAYLAAVYNLRRQPLDRSAVRRALTLLLDREGVARELFGGYARVVTGPYLPGSAEEDGAVEALPFAPAAAAALLGELRPELTVLVPVGSRTVGRIADIWAADARPHVRLKIEPLAYPDLLARLREGRFDIALLSFTTDRDLDLHGRFHTSQHGAENYGAVADADLDRLLDRARREPDPQARARLQRRIHRRLHELQPYTFIVSDGRLGLARTNIGGLSAPAHGLAARHLWKSR